MSQYPPNRMLGHSETFEQREYEDQLAKRQKQKPFIIGPIHEYDLEGEGEDEDPNATLDQQQQKKKKKSFVWRKWRVFWEKVIKPAFPEAITDLKIIFGMAALKSRLKKEITNATLFPEINDVAEVRRGLGLCNEEIAYLAKRKEIMRVAFAKYLDLNPDDVHPDDVPIISFGGSGGGFRALIGFLGYMEAMKERGLWDCLAYVAGVSGACWALGAYYTIADCNFQRAIDHCKMRFSPYHPLSSDAIRAILSTPSGAKITLGPLIQKRKAGLDTYAMDWYAVLTTGWILFQGEAKLHIGHIRERDSAFAQQSWLKFSSIRRHIDNGKEPLPILTAIRHERPSDKPRKGSPPRDDVEAGTPDGIVNAWYQWFEMTPYEVGCDEVEGWVPTWGFGRPFKQGKSTMQLPEQSMSMLLGLATSAPAAPLASYLSTINRNLSYGLFGTSIREMARTVSWYWGKKGTEEFKNHHPLHACEEYNFLHSDGETATKEASSIESSPTIELIDSGMDNNCPTYVLLHPNRDMDLIINMDASSDVLNDVFQERVDQIGSRRGMKFTKRDGNPEAEHHDESANGAPKEDQVVQEPQQEEETTENNGESTTESPDNNESDDAKKTNPYEGKYAQIYDGVPCERPPTVVDSYGKTVTNPPAPVFTKECTMIYMPIIPNEEAVPDFNPSTAKFSGSYNLIWSPEQVEMLIKLSKANFEAGEETVKKAMYESWQRRKAAREAASQI